MVERRIEGKVALVTGAGRGIGRLVAERLAAEGATVIVHYNQSAAGAEETARLICAAGGKAILCQADITRRAEVIAMFEQIDRDPGRLDIVVNNAGGGGGGSLEALDEDEMEWMIGLNFRGPLYVTSEAARRLGEGGRVINFSSSVARFPLAGAGVYSAVKSAVESLTESWSKELGRKGITVNCVIPGATSPGMIDASSEYLDFFKNASPFGRIGRAEEIAAVVAFLASPEASWVSGAKILVNGAANT
ncbi:MAG: SDR family oxidoreductase [Novosphingobium sp.]|nr:SDR family oxidoreductase [Novosphingobium sp.]